jgi:hypothetical protein
MGGWLRAADRLTRARTPPLQDVNYWNVKGTLRCCVLKWLRKGRNGSGQGRADGRGVEWTHRPSGWKMINQLCYSDRIASMASSPPMRSVRDGGLSAACGNPLEQGFKVLRCVLMKRQGLRRKRNTVWHSAAFHGITEQINCDTERNFIVSRTFAHNQPP